VKKEKKAKNFKFYLIFTKQSQKNTLTENRAKKNVVITEC